MSNLCIPIGNDVTVMDSAVDADNEDSSNIQGGTHGPTSPLRTDPSTSSSPPGKTCVRNELHFCLIIQTYLFTIIHTCNCTGQTQENLEINYIEQMMNNPKHGTIKMIMTPYNMNS